MSIKNNVRDSLMCIGASLPSWAIILVLVTFYGKVVGNLVLDTFGACLVVYAGSCDWLAFILFSIPEMK